ncbi:MAG: FAD-dependent oxidoreductase [Pseudonocardiales bacterium]|nr:MAG: FAD-dependent oxidoreductase [Pseudonocardiales bacterium]
MVRHRPGSSEVPDAVVIGAGHNGLVAANILADAGWSVLVLEAADHAGGAVHSAESVRSGFVTDLFSAFYPLGAASPVLSALELDRYGLSWSHAPSVLAHVLPDDRCALLCRDVAGTAASLDEFAAGDGDAWTELVAEFERIREPLLAALFRPFPPVLPAARLLHRLGTAGALRFARFATQPVRRFGDERFHGEGGPLLLAGNALHTDLPPEGAGSAIYGWLLAMLGQTVGFPVPAGGSGRLVDALVARLAARGGHLRLGSGVEKVLVTNNRAVGVRLVDGTTVRVGRAVLADSSAPDLYRSLVGVEHLPGRLVRDLDNFQWDAPTLKVNWALSGPIPWTAAAARGAGTVHVGVDMDGLTFYAASLAARRVPPQPFVLVGQMTTADPARSPAGTESVWAYTHLPEKLELGPAVIAAHVERIEQIMQRHAPGFGALVLDRQVQSPADLQHANPSLVGGATNSGTASLHQQLVFRPVPGLARAETVIDRLYLAGASAHPGGGVHGGPGHNAARAALGRESASGPARRRMLELAMGRIYAG